MRKKPPLRREGADGGSSLAAPSFLSVTLSDAVVVFLSLLRYVVFPSSGTTRVRSRLKTKVVVVEGPGV